MNSQVIYGKTVQGKRSNNEDAMLACTFHGDVNVIAVADGMGGVEGGEIASSLVIKNISDYFEDHWNVNEKNLKDHLKNVFTSAQSLLRSKIAEEPELKGMGTTLTCLVVYQNFYAWASIGDSRLYKVSKDTCQLLTNDHTYQNELLRSENSGAENNDYSHILTKVIDGGYDEPDYFPAEEVYSNLEKQELFMICSDGAIVSKSNTDHSWFYDLVNETDDISDLADLTIENALKLGSADNITVTLLNLDFYSPDNKRKKKKHNKSVRKLKVSKNSNKWNKRAIVIVLMALSFISGWVLGTFSDLIPFAKVGLIPAQHKSIGNGSENPDSDTNVFKTVDNSNLTHEDMQKKDSIKDTTNNTSKKPKVN